MAAKADLYGKSKIEKLSSVDRTDRTLKITGPAVYSVIIAVVFIIAALIIYLHFDGVNSERIIQSAECRYYTTTDSCGSPERECVIIGD